VTGLEFAERDLKSSETSAMDVKNWAGESLSLKEKEMGIMGYIFIYSI
jgi:hypothetical protein